MKKQIKMNETEAQANNQTVNNQAKKATEKKEEKKMTSKKSETAIIIPETIDQNLFKVYRLNDQNEVLMTSEMFDEFKAANGETLRFGSMKNDKTVRLVALAGKGTKAFAKVRLDEEAKKKQVHIHTGATKKVCSARNEKTGMRYKVIFRAKGEKFEIWSADNAGKRKMVKRDTDKAVVMAEYEKLVGMTETKAEKKAAQRTTKKAQKSA